jgi:hypothetical protein
VQAESSRLAAAAGTAATQATTVASLQRSIDVSTFLQWLEAARSDIDSGRIDPTAAAYAPDQNTLSGFIALRFRKEFEPAFATWIASRPLQDANAAPTPFQLPEYALAVDARVAELSNEAQAQFLDARAATHRAENYITLTFLFAIALVFAGIAIKLEKVWASGVLLALALVAVITAAFGLLSYPAQI